MTNFPIVREYKLDIKRENLDNLIGNEPIEVTPGIRNRVFIPRHAPFFTESLSLTTLSGAPLYPDVDYRIFRLNGHLTELTAQPVASMIEFVNPNVNAALVTYHTIGDTSLFDKALMQLITDAVNDDRPVYWEDIQNKPIVFPPSLHGHSLLYEITNFQDALDLIVGLTSLVEQYDDSIIAIKMTTLTNLFKHYVDLYKAMLLEVLGNHTGSYNSHGLTKAHVGLDKVDNFATATTAELLQPADDLLVTPGGLQTIFADFRPSTSEYLENNNLPLSSYKGVSYLPPPIDGSFEGLGSRSEAAAIWMEDDGTMMYIVNRFDGRVNALYYMYCQDYLLPTADFIFSGVKYVHPIFTQNNDNVDMVFNGSNGDVMLVGDTAKTSFYLGRCNGTLDVDQHVYSKFDMMTLFRRMSATITPNRDMWLQVQRKINVVRMGTWVYFFVSTVTADATDTLSEYNNLQLNTWLFRCPYADIGVVGTITPTLITSLTYNNLDNTQYNATNRMVQLTPVKDNTKPGDYYTKYFHTFNRSQTVFGLYRGMTVLAEAVPGKANTFAVKLVHFINYNDPVTAKEYVEFIEQTHELDLTTHTFTKLHQTPARSVNLDDSTLQTLVNSLYWFAGALAAFSVPGVNVTSDGIINAHAAPLNGYRNFVQHFKLTGLNNRYDTIRTRWYDYRNIPANTNYFNHISPVKSSNSITGIMFKEDGNVGKGKELYVARRQNDYGRARLFKKIATGDYANNPDVQNVLIPNILSRPLNNNIQEYNCLWGIGKAGMSGHTSYLNAKGIVAPGKSSFTMNLQNKHFPRNSMGTHWPAVGNADDIELISVWNEIVNTDGTLDIQPTKMVIYPKTVVDLIKNLRQPTLVAQSPQVFVNVADINTDDMQIRIPRVPAVAIVTYALPNNDAIRRSFVVTFLPTYNKTNPARWVVSSIDVLDIQEFTINDVCWGVAPGTFPVVQFGIDDQDRTTLGMPQRAYFYFTDDNTVEISLNTGVYSRAPGNWVDFGYTVRLTNNMAARPTGAAISIWGLGYGENGFVALPDNYMTFLYNDTVAAGGAAAITTGTKKYMIGSIYPEVGWTVFFKSSVKATFNGVAYTLPQGSIDLRDIDTAPQNKTFYIYALLRGSTPVYEISTEKRMETPFLLWIGKVVTNATQIVTLERFNVFSVNGKRISEAKRGNSIPASTGSYTQPGQIPWLRTSEILPG